MARTKKLIEPSVEPIYATKPISAIGLKWLRDMSFKQAVEKQINQCAMANGSREIRVIVEQVF